MAELGALSLRIEEQGGAGVLAQLEKINGAAKITGTTVDQAAAALNSLGIAAKVVGGNISVAENEVGRATSIVRQLGSDAKVAAIEIEKLAGAAAKVPKLTAPKPFLGPALPTTTTESAAKASANAIVRSEAAAEQAIGRRIAIMAKGAQMEATRASAIQRLIGIETSLTSALAKGNLTQEQRIRLNVLLAQTQRAVASGTENVAAAQAARIAADQKAIDAAHGQALAMDRQRTAAEKMSPKIRSGASAIAALAIAATTGGGSLTGMATQAGLVGSVMAAEFAPAKWAGYAAGIGAAVIAVTALVGIMMKLNAEAQKPRRVVLTQIEDTRIPEILETRAAELRKERDALDKFILEAKRVGFVSTAGVGEEKRPVTPPAFEGTGATPKSLREAQNRQKQLEAEFSEANKRLGDILGDRSKELQSAAIEGIVTAAEATKGVRLSELAKEQAQVEAAFQQGTNTLKEQYDGRRKAVIEGAKAERAAMEAQRAALLKVLPGEDLKGAAVAGRRVEAGAVSAEIKALANETSARLTALDQQRAHEEQALAAKVFGYQVQLEQITNTSFEHRMTQIRAEDLERRRTLNQRGNATQEEVAALDSLRDKQEAQLRLQVQMAEIERLRAELALRLQDIENQRLAGLLDEEQASREIVKANRELLPDIQTQVDLAIAWAEKLGEQGVLGALKALKAELATPVLLNIDIDTDLISKRLNAAVAKIRSDVATGVLDAESGRKAVDQAQFAAGFASAISDSIAQGGLAALQGKNPLQALGQAMSSSLGSILVSFGKQALAGSAIMGKLQLAMASLNPWAAAAIAASLIVFGTALGGKGGSGGSGFSGSSTAPTPISISRLIVDPNAGVRQRIASAGMQSAAGSSGPTQVIEVIGISTPRGQELIGTANARYSGRGG